MTAVNTARRLYRNHLKGTRFGEAMMAAWLRFQRSDWMIRFKLSRWGSLSRSTVRARYVYQYFAPRLKWGMQWIISSNEITNFTYDITRLNRIYLAHTLALVTGKTNDEILAYIAELDGDDELKRVIVGQMRSHAQRYFSDERILYGRRIGWYAAVRALKPKVVVETGVDKGLGSAVICAALRRNAGEGHEGRYFGTDLQPAAGFLLGPPYSAFGEILRGDSIESLRNLPFEIDLFINDSDHSAAYEAAEYQTIKQKLSPQAVILGDNAHVTDELAKFAADTRRCFLYFKEEPAKFWEPGAGIGIAFR